ncbi:MAG: hypothetical protein HKP01_07705, partial [Gemmatimonadetes bacterium]|nr:hypothetical protein [Gemmatimonadota bacterium]
MQRRLDANPGSVGADDDEKGLFRVERIEISGFGSWIGGATYLELPPPLTELTFDTGAQDILDFSGLVPQPAGPNSSVIAPRKEIEPGWQAGGATTFYLTPNFGISLTGTIGQADAVFTGQVERIEERPDPDNPGQTIDVTIREPRSEIDRTTVTTWTGTAGIIYHILPERKYNTRPFVTLGIGGILNQFPDTDDVSALTWNVGLGVGFPVYKSFRGFVSTGLRFYVWETDEVDLDQTLVFPEISAGIVWRYYVPEDEEEPVLPAPDPAAPVQGETAGG